MKWLFIIGLMALLWFFNFINGSITGGYLLSAPVNDDFIEVNPLMSVDKIIASGVEFFVKTISNPLINDSSFMIINVNGGPVCVNEVLINGLVKWSGDYCVNNSSKLIVPFTPLKSGGYPLIVHYSVNGVEANPLMFVVNVNPLIKSSVIDSSFIVNNLFINDSVNLTSGQDLSVKLFIKARNFVKINNGLMIIKSSDDLLVREVVINKLIPPFIPFSKVVNFKLPELSSGDYLVNFYLYVNVNGVNGIVSKSVNCKVL